ncbi:MAG: hypothetical protein U1D69_14080 [Polynucleobacter sp.]|nr:hypothetical protein [Polynucleobacter sp.]
MDGIVDVKAVRIYNAFTDMGHESVLFNFRFIAGKVASDNGIRIQSDIFIAAHPLRDMINLKELFVNNF